MTGNAPATRAGFRCSRRCAGAPAEHCLRTGRRSRRRTGRIPTGSRRAEVRPAPGVQSPSAPVPAEDQACRAAPAASRPEKRYARRAPLPQKAPGGAPHTRSAPSASCHPPFFRSLPDQQWFGRGGQPSTSTLRILNRRKQSSRSGLEPRASGCFQRFGSSIPQWGPAVKPCIF